MAPRTSTAARSRPKCRACFVSAPVSCYTCTTRVSLCFIVLQSVEFFPQVLITNHRFIFIRMLEKRRFPISTMILAAIDVLLLLFYLGTFLLRWYHKKYKEKPGMITQFFQWLYESSSINVTPYFAGVWTFKAAISINLAWMHVVLPLPFLPYHAILFMVPCIAVSFAYWYHLIYPDNQPSSFTFY